MEAISRRGEITKTNYCTTIAVHRNTRPAGRNNTFGTHCSISFAIPFGTRDYNINYSATTPQPKTIL